MFTTVRDETIDQWLADKRRQEPVGLSPRRCPARLSGAGHRRPRG